MSKAKISDLLNKFDKIFSATLSESYRADFSQKLNIISDSLGYGSIVDQENKETALYIITDGNRKSEIEELIDQVLAFDQETFDVNTYEPIKIEDVLFVNFILLNSKMKIEEYYSERYNCYLVFTKVNELWGSKHKKLLDVKRIWRHEELTEELYYKRREEFKEKSVTEQVVDKIHQTPEKKEFSSFIIEKMHEMVSNWNQDLIDSEKRIFDLIQLKENNIGLQQQSDWQEWQKYFSSTNWVDVCLIYDHQLHTGTLIFYDYIDQTKNIEAGLLKDLSWALLKVLSYRQTKGSKVALHSISFIVIDDFKDSNEVYLSSKIINKVQQQSELLYETKLIPLRKLKVDTYKRNDWEEQFLANHLIPLRRKENKFDELRTKIVSISKVAVEQLQLVKKQISLLNNESNLVESVQYSKYKKEIHKITKFIERLEKIQISENTLGDSINQNQRLNVIDAFFVGIKLFTERPLVIELKKKLNLIFAPNGYGKSTIVDGLKNMVVDHSGLHEHDHLPLWNVKIKDSVGVFGVTNKRAQETVERFISKESEHPLKKETYIEGQDDKSGTINIPPESFDLFCYASNLEEHFHQDMVHQLIRQLVPQLDLNFLSLLDDFSSEDPNIKTLFDDIIIIVQNLKEEILTQIQDYFLDLLTVCTTVMTADSWLYTLGYDFDINHGIRLKNTSEQVDKEESSQKKTKVFELKQVLNMGEQKIVDLAIFFLFYYFEGCKYSDVVILDDVFATFDDRQCYNFLRFIMTFKNLPKMKDRQFIILSHRKSIFDYFYYGNLRYLNRDIKDSAGYFNFIMREEYGKGKENYSKYIEELGSSTEEVDLDKIPVIEEE